MTFTLRPYQQVCVDKGIAHLKKSIEPCVIDAAPAAGKSFMIAGLANGLYEISGGKRVLCLAPSAQLIKQNAEKYKATGEPCSIFSASAGGKSLRHKVIFGTPKTVLNKISRFKTGYCAVVIDECHGITPTIINIIDQMKIDTPNLRVIGLSGTPFRLGSGYIYRINPDDTIVPEDQASDPYFSKMVHRVSAKEMLDQGFICPMVVGAPIADGYDTSLLLMDNKGKFTTSSVDQAFVGQGRETAAIVADVIEQSRNRNGGVMFFAATVQHAQEIFDSLPPQKSGIVIGADDAKSDDVIKRYRSGDIRYLVSVGKLTTGFDVTHTEVIAMLRRTESAALFQQIMGRAWRLDPTKKDSLLLDYADNVETHFSGRSIYDPIITANAKKSGEMSPIVCNCPECSTENEYSARPNPDELDVDPSGYFMDLMGNTVMSEHGPTPAHYGRRCMGMRLGRGGVYVQCDYRYTSKECPHCAEPNDIAAKYCCSCKGEIINPNEKLAIEFRRMKRDPSQPQCDVIIDLNIIDMVSKAGNPQWRVDIRTEYRKLSFWFLKEPKTQGGWNQLQAYLEASKQMTETPRTISYMKETSGFYRPLAWNKQEDLLE